MAKGKYESPEVSVSYPSFIEFWRMKFVVVRSALIGFFCGVLPGIGATLAAFMSYNEAVRWSKRPEKFGTGEPEGVVAPETVNNAATGAAMIPLLALGLPGGALTAMMIAVFNLHDMDIGPLIMVEAHDLVWVLFASMFWASLAILLLGVVEAKGIVNLLRIPFNMLAPAILVFATIGAFALRSNILDVLYNVHSRCSRLFPAKARLFHSGTGHGGYTRTNWRGQLFPGNGFAGLQRIQFFLVSDYRDSCISGIDHDSDEYYSPPRAFWNLLRAVHRRKQVAIYLLVKFREKL